MTPPRFTAAEYLALVGAVDRLEQEAAEPDGGHARRDAQAANRALAKVRASLSPAVLREVDRRLAPPPG